MSVYVLERAVTPEKTDKSIEMLFGGELMLAQKIIGCTLVLWGEYNRMIQVCQGCSFMANYFDHLFL